MVVKVIKVKHNITLKDILKDVETPLGIKSVFDMVAIKKIFKDFNLKMLFSERGSKGKTQGLKTLALDEFYESGRKSMFMRNTGISMEKELTKVLSNSTIAADYRFAKCKLIGSFKKSKCFMYDEKNKPFIYYSALNGASDEKGSREIYQNIIIDEMNEKWNLVRPNYTEAMSSIMSSTYNQVSGDGDNTSVWLLGNFKSINHPYIIGLGIKEMIDPISCYYITKKIDGKVYKAPLCVVIRSSFTEQQVKDKTRELFEKDFRFRLDLATGEASHTYFNNTLSNEIHNIKNYHLGSKRPEFYIRTQKEYIAIYYLSDGNLKNGVGIWLRLVKKDKLLKDIPVMVLNNNLHIENTQFDRVFGESVKKHITNNTVFYKDIATRVLFLGTLNVK